MHKFTLRFLVRFLDMTISDLLSTLGVNLSDESRLIIFHAFLHGSYEGTLHTLQFILQNFIQIDDKLSSMDALFGGVGEFIRTQEQLQVLREIDTTHRVRMTTQVQTIVRQAIASGQSNSGLLALVEGQVNGWLEEKYPGSGYALTSMSLMSLLTLIACVKMVLS